MVPWVSLCQPQYIIKVLAPRWRWDTKLTHSSFPYLAAPLFSTVTGPQRGWLFSLLGAAVTSQANANADETKSKRICSWYKCCKFLQSIGLRSDFFLDRFSCWQRQLVLIAFEKDVRQAEFSQVPKKILVAATFRDTIGYISKAFNASLRCYPRRDPDGWL